MDTEIYENYGEKLQVGIKTQSPTQKAFHPESSTPNMNSQVVNSEPVEVISKLELKPRSTMTILSFMRSLNKQHVPSENDSNSDSDNAADRMNRNNQTKKSLNIEEIQPTRMRKQPRPTEAKEQIACKRRKSSPLDSQAGFPAGWT